MPTDTSIFESSSCHFHEDQDIHVEWFLAEDDPDRDLQNVRGLIIDAEVVPQVRDLQTTGTSRLGDKPILGKIVIQNIVTRS